MVPQWSHLSLMAHMQFQPQEYSVCVLRAAMGQASPIHSLESRSGGPAA